MKKQMVVGFLGVILLSGAMAHADDVTVTIDSLTNVSGNGSLEACGTAVSKDGAKPLLVTLKHDESFYTTMTAANNKWCVVFKRWTFDGKVDVSATSFKKPEAVNWLHYSIKELIKDSDNVTQ